MVDIVSAAAGAGFLEVSPFEFYRDLFPVGSFEEKGIYEDGKYNGIAVSIGKGESSIKRMTITDEFIPEKYKTVISSKTATEN